MSEINVQHSENFVEVVGSPAAEISTSIENPEIVVQLAEDENSSAVVEIINSDPIDITTNLESVEISLEVTSEGPRGPEGPQGPPGIDGKQGIDGKKLEYDWQGTRLGVRVEGDSEFEYQDLVGAETFIYETQESRLVWEVTHNLNKYPSVSVVDTANNLVHGDIEYIDRHNLKITFSSRFSGKAYLN